MYQCLAKVCLFIHASNRMLTRQGFELRRSQYEEPGVLNRSEGARTSRIESSTRLFGFRSADASFLIHQESGRPRRVGQSLRRTHPRTHARRTAGIALSTMQITIGKLMLWLLSLDALAVLLQVHVGTSNKLPTRWERFRGGATTSQAILLTSGSLVTLSGAKAVVEGQRKSSEQVRACPPPHALLLQTTRKPRPHCRTP